MINDWIYNELKEMCCDNLEEMKDTLEYLQEKLENEINNIEEEDS